jgi:hypothetical protein
MIPMKNIMGAVRFRIGDPQGVKVSDFQIIEAVNSAVKRIYMTGGQKDMNFALKKTALFVDENGDGLHLPNTTPLPGDFFRVKKVYNFMSKELGYSPRRIPGYSGDECRYRIYADTFEAVPGSYMLEYFWLPPRAGNAEGVLPVPRSLEMTVIDAVSAILKDGELSAQAVIEAELFKMTAQENSGYEDRGPVQVWGGKA